MSVNVDYNVQTLSKTVIHQFNTANRAIEWMEDYKEKHGVNSPNLIVVKKTTTIDEEVIYGVQK